MVDFSFFIVVNYFNFLSLDKTISDLQELLETIHQRTLQHFPLNPLQKITRIPFELFNAPLKIREDLECKRKTHKSDREKEYKKVTDPTDLFEVDGRPAENVYMLGEAGRGKTGQCYQLVQHWVEARKAHKESKGLSNWQESLIEFDFLFLVSLRHVDKRIHSIVEMICCSVMKNYPQYHETIRQVLFGTLHTCKCLIIIDGLDERKGAFDIDVDISRCTIFMTSRPWKFYDLAPYINDRDKVVEICGLEDSEMEQVIKKVLINYFEIDNETTELETKVSDILHNTRDEKYKSIMDIPLLLTAFVFLWQSDMSLQESMTSFYVSLLNLLVKLAFNNERVTNVPAKMQSAVNAALSLLPNFIRKQRKLRCHLDILIALGKVAYGDLVLGNKNKQNEEKHNDEYRQRFGTSQLVFEKDELLDMLGEEVLTFALEVGLLSQSSAPGSFDDENVSINFFHKTIEEFLAALYISCSNEACSESWLKSCSSLRNLMEMSNFLIFMVGIQPSLCSALSEHIEKIFTSDIDIMRYRLSFDKTRWTIGVMLKMLCECNKEMKWNLLQSNITTTVRFRITDVYVDQHTDDSTLVFVTEVLSQDNGDIVSLYILNLDMVVKSNLYPSKLWKSFLITRHHYNHCTCLMYMYLSE